MVRTGDERHQEEAERQQERELLAEHLWVLDLGGWGGWWIDVGMV